MSIPFCTVPGVAVRIGYCSQTTAKILVVSLRGGTVSATCSGGSVVVPTLAGKGDDNPAQVGKYVAATGVVEISGLSAFTRYTYSITCDGKTVSGSFTTLPADAVTDYSFTMWTCENRSAASQWMKEPVYKQVRELVEGSDVPVLFTAHIDDNLYADIFKFFGINQTDPTTGLYVTAGSGQQGPCATGLQWDYAVAWCGWIGLLPSVAELAQDDRLWVFRNVPLWTIWGDHEIGGDHCSSVYDGLGVASLRWGCNRATYNNGEPNTANLEAKAEEMYEAFCASACTPPRLAADGGPASQAGAQYWGAVVGPVRFFAFDRNKHALPYNACDAGDTHTYGRAGTPSAGTCAGATKPTRTELGVLTDTQPHGMLMEPQLTDMLGWLNNDEPFKVIFASNGISMHNQPWNEYWPNEFEDYVGRASTGLMQNPKTNGTTGYSCHLKGDTHGLGVVSYHANGSTGLGGASVASGELWEICPATINGSTIGGNLFNVIHAGGKRRYVKCGVTQGDRQLASTLYCKVLASLPAREFHVSLIQLPNKQVVWTGFQKEGQTGNGFQYVDVTPKIG